MAKCPTCGGLLDEQRMIVDLTTNFIAFRGLRWRVSRKLAQFLFKLNEAWPNAVTEEDLMTALWGVNNDRDPVNLAVYASHLRNMLAPVNCKIRHINATYRLQISDTEDAPSWPRQIRSRAYRQASTKTPPP